MLNFSFRKRRQVGKPGYKRVTLLLVTLLWVGTFTASLTATIPTVHAAVNLTQYVNPFMGSSNGGQAYPGETQPFGMMQWSLDTNSGESNEYDYNSSTVAGFSLIHYTGYGPRMVNFVPFVGSVSTSPGSNPSSYYSTFSHNNESATPGYYQVKTDSGINVQLSGTQRAGSGQFTYPTTNSTATMIINLGDSPADGGKPTINSATVDSTSSKLSGFAGQSSYKLYFVAQFDHPFSSYGTFNGSSVSAGSTTSGTATDVGSYVSFNVSSNATVGVRVGISYVSVANAQANLDAEIPAGTSFNTLKTDAANNWNTILSHVAVNDPNALSDDLTKFYTQLYFFLTQPNIVSDRNGNYWGADNTMHTVATGHTQYATFSAWDQGRSFWPLMAFLFPNETSDAIQSYLDASHQWSEHRLPGMMLPTATEGFGGNNFSLPAQAYAFGAQGFDASDAEAQLVKVSNDTNAGRGNALIDYVNQGYAPGSPENTLSWALSDFATAQLAQALGDTANATALINRSTNWYNTFLTTANDNGYTGYTWFRNSDGTYRTFTSSTNGTGSSTNGNGFTETCSSEFSYLVPQNLAGLVLASGGKATFVNRLDHFFSQFNYIGYNTDNDPSCQYYDVGNEPDLQVPWQYDWVGTPSHTQDVVRRIINQVYTNSPGGLPGNNDWGAMSAWYVEAVLGIYPEIQGVGGFAINSPLFASVTLTLENGHTLVINGNSASRANEYIQSATLNGSNYDSPWIPYSALVNTNSTNTLTFVLGNSASNWGSNPSLNPPPSFSPASSSNLALNKTATASSQCASSEGPFNAIDGLSNTKWCAGLTNGAAWLKIDLGATYNLTNFTLLNASNECDCYVTRDYKIQWSSDGSDNGTWNDLVTVTGNTNNVVNSTLPLTSQPARWVRLYVTAPEQGSGGAARIYEFGVYGNTPNLALNKTATSDSTPCGSGQGPQEAVDATLSTKWCEGFSGAGWLKVDLGRTYTLTNFAIKHAGAGYDNSADNTLNFKIQTSANGSDSGTWNDLVTVTGNTQSYTYHTISPTTARWVRLYITAGQQDGSAVARIYEFEVYGLEPNPITTTTAVNLSNAYNLDGISREANPTDGNLDGKGNTYSADLLPARSVLNRVNYNFGPTNANALNVVQATGQTIALPAGNYTSLSFVGTAVNQSQSGSFVVNYTDGSSVTSNLTLSDWYTGPQNGEAVAVNFSHRNEPGGPSSSTFYLYGYNMVLNSTKSVSSLTLPNNSNIKLLAVSLTPTS